MTALAQRLTTDPLGPICCGISDDDIEALAREEIGKITAPLRAMKGKVIAWVAPFRKEGVVDVPWDFRQNSVEAVIVEDGSGLELPRGTVVMIHPEEGIYHEVDGVRLCFLERRALLLAKAA
jgi:hypothetical protein